LAFIVRIYQDARSSECQITGNFMKGHDCFQEQYYLKLVIVNWYEKHDRLYRVRCSIYHFIGWNVTCGCWLQALACYQRRVHDARRL